MFNFMNRSVFAKAALGAVLSLAAFGGVANAAGGVGFPVKDYDWSFEGPFGTFDKKQLQRGYQVYAQVCAQCHGMKFLHYRDLGREGGPNFPEAMVEAIAAQIEVPGINEDGEEIMRPALPIDKFKEPFPNKERAIATHGAYPPDLSLIAKARTGYKGILNQVVKGGGAPEYLYSLLTGYAKAPDNFDLPAGSHFNIYYKNHAIKMAPPLNPELLTYQVKDEATGQLVEKTGYQDGTEATVDQMAKDVVAFLVWAAEPSMEDRKRAGFANIVFLVIFAVLLWFSTKRLWKRVKQGEDVH